MSGADPFLLRSFELTLAMTQPDTGQTHQGLRTWSRPV